MEKAKRTAQAASVYSGYNIGKAAAKKTSLTKHRRAIKKTMTKGQPVPKTIPNVYHAQKAVAAKNAIKPAMKRGKIGLGIAVGSAIIATPTAEKGRGARRHA